MAQNTTATQRGGTGAGLGIVLIILGITFLAQQLFGFDIWATAWPFGIVAIGLTFFVAMVLGGKGAASLAIPGSVITTIGLILAYQNAFDRYETWSYAWALIVVAVGLGLLIKGFWTDDPKAFQGGLRTAGIGAILFVVFGAFFELVVGFAGAEYANVANRWFWPVLLIAVGAAILLRRGPRHDAR